MNPTANAATTGETVTRTARLFRAGVYPDRNATITAGDLDTIVTRFEADGVPVPLRVEHTETVLDPVGAVSEVYRRGAELFGTVTIAGDVAAHLDRYGAASHLSVTLTRSDAEPGYRLTEVSLVREPRVEGAGFVETAFALNPSIAQNAIDTVFARFRREGKLTPAMETPLRELLTGNADETQFAATSPTVRLESLTRLLTALPVSRTMSGDGGTLTALVSPLDTVFVPASLARACAGLGVSVSDAAKYF